MKEIVENIKDEGRFMSVRPDSGKPEEVVVEVLNTMDKLFGPSEVNEKGFKELPSFLKVIQGDGMNEENLDKTLKAMMAIK